MLRSCEVSAGKHEGKKKKSEDLDWIQLAKDKNQCRYLMAMNLRTSEEGLCSVGSIMPLLVSITTEMRVSLSARDTVKDRNDDLKREAYSQMRNGVPNSTFVRSEAILACLTL